MSFKNIDGFRQRKNEVKYLGVFLLEKDNEPKRPGGITGRKKKVYVETNAKDGDYLVYFFNSKNKREDIFEYKAKEDEVDIKKGGLYKKFFTGDDVKEQLDKLTSKTRRTTYKIAEKLFNAKKITKNNFEKLGTYKAYKTYVNKRKNDEYTGGDKNKPSKDTRIGPVRDFKNKKYQDVIVRSKSPDKIPKPTTSKGVYRYPKRHLEELGYDYMMIEPYTYVPSFKAKASGSYFGDSSGEVILLPMVPGLQTSNGTQWNEDNADLVRLALGNLGRNFILQSSNPGGELASNFGAAFQGAMADGGAIINTLMQDDFLRDNIASYFAGKAAGVNILGRSTGQVINPNLEVLFKGPKLRSFNFQFTMTPRGEKEAETIRDIIRIFKHRMAPRRSPTGLFLQTPYIFKLKYIYNDKTKKTHKFLNKFKPCALTECTVNYTPENQYATLTNGSMTQYQLGLAFNEIETIYASDYDGEDEMGF